MLSRLKNIFKRSAPALYTEEELRAVEQHIEMHCGAYKTVMHEIVSPDIHVDIFPISPTPERNYYTLVTCGMGARKMNIPDDCKELARAELAIVLPPDWKLNEKSEKWYWPIRLLTTLARYPINADTWVGWGHTLVPFWHRVFLES